MDMKILLTASLISLSLSACSHSASQSQASSQPKKTVAEVMKQQTSNEDVTDYRQSIANTDHQSVDTVNVRERSRQAPLLHYTRSEARELQGIFPRLPNPDLCMYVYPHLSLEDATIPGYTSCFSMYDKNHYALPGEMTAIMQAKY